MVLANQTVQVRVAPPVPNDELASMPVFVKLAESKRVVLCFHQRTNFHDRSVTGSMLDCAALPTESSLIIPVT